MISEETLQSIYDCACLWVRDDERDDRPMSREWEEARRAMLAIPAMVDALEACYAYFRDTRHGKEWIDSGGQERYLLDVAFAELLGQPAPKEPDGGEEEET